MDERDEQAPLRDLEQRLDQARRGRETAGKTTGADAAQVGSGLAQGFRIGLELVVALVVGVGLGWACDTWLGAAPWGVILGFFFGMAAGIANVYRVMMGISRAVGYRPGVAPGQQGKVGWSNDEE